LFSVVVANGPGMAGSAAGNAPIVARGRVNRMMNGVTRELNVSTIAMYTTRMATPTVPAIRPATARPPGRCPPARASNSASQIGVVAMIRAAMPDAMYCSPNTTPPLPPSRSNVPMMTTDRSWGRVNRSPGSPRTRRQTAIATRRMAPDSAYRKPAATSGGSVRTMTAMPRYVEPHTT